MRTMEFSIEENGDKITIGQTIGVKDSDSPGGYSYMLEDALGMSGLYKFGERLEAEHGKVIEKKKTDRFNIAVLEFEEG